MAQETAKNNGLFASRKAQTEVFGIAVIVILLVIGMVLGLRAAMQPSKPIVQSFVQSHQSQDLLNALAETRSRCPALTITDEIKDWREGTNLCDSAYLEPSLTSILEQTLAIQKKPYRFRIFGGDIEDGVTILSISNDMTAEEGTSVNEVDEDQIGISLLVREKPGFLYIPTGGGSTMTVMLEIFTPVGRR